MPREDYLDGDPTERLARLALGKVASADIRRKAIPAVPPVSAEQIARARRKVADMLEYGAYLRLREGIEMQESAEVMEAWRTYHITRRNEEPPEGSIHPNVMKKWYAGIKLLEAADRVRPVRGRPKGS